MASAVSPELVSTTTRSRAEGPPASPGTQPASSPRVLCASGWPPPRPRSNSASPLTSDTTTPAKALAFQPGKFASPPVTTAANRDHPHGASPLLVRAADLKPKEWREGGRRDPHSLPQTWDEANLKEDKLVCVGGGQPSLLWWQVWLRHTHSQGQVWRPQSWLPATAVSL